MKLSIIIPVYNVEQYLQRCLDSCIKQDIPLGKYEIIVVNDGSSDGSLTIAKNFAQHHSFITVISQHNKGLSSARNEGLKVAKGEYVWFVDSDDWIAENCLGSIVNKCISLELDILAISKANVINGVTHNRFLYNSELEKEVIKGISSLKRKLLKSVCVPFAIYRKKFLKENDIKCFEGVFHEDHEFTPRAYYLAKRVSYFNNICYYAYERKNSIMTTINPKRSFDLIQIANQLHIFSNEKVYKEDMYIFHQYISNCINESLHLSVNFSKEIKNKLIIEFNKNKHLIYHLIKSKSIKYKLEGILFLLFPCKIDTIYNSLIKIKAK